MEQGSFEQNPDKSQSKFDDFKARLIKLEKRVDELSRDVEQLKIAYGLQSASIR